MSRLDRKLLVVTGKGGVGRSTVCAALGHAAAQLGKRTVVVELSGQESAAQALGLPHGTYEPQPVGPRLDHRTLTASECLIDFAGRKLHLPSVSAWLLSSKPMATFLDAVPGLHDLLQLGKLENMIVEPLEGEPTWDLTILDAPATGHGLTLLAAARAMRDTARVGPFHELASIIERFLSDEQLTGFVVITLPELLPVHEALELSRALAADHAPPAAIWVNRCAPTWPDDAAASTLRSTLAGADTVASGALVQLLDHAAQQSARQRVALDTLEQDASTVPPPSRVALPDLSDPTDLSPLVALLRATLATGAA